jgi:hypothetical protein
MIKELVQGIKQKWNGITEKASGEFQARTILMLFNSKRFYFGTRKQRTQRFRGSLRLNNSTKNRSIRSIKTSNHIAKGIYFKDCPDGN